MDPQFSFPPRISSKIFKTDTCWLWLGYITKNGYGRTSFGRKHYLAHRVMYTLFKGTIPKGKQLDHTCRVRRCVNPDHLEPVTSKENSQRGEHPNFVTASTRVCKRGHLVEGKNNYRGKCYMCRNDASNRYKKRIKDGVSV